MVLNSSSVSGPYDFDDAPSIYERQVLGLDSSRELESLIKRDDWKPLA